MVDTSVYRSQALDAMTQMDSLFDSLSKHGSMKGVKSDEITSMRGQVESIRQRVNEQKLTVAVLALTKSGKTDAIIVVSSHMHIATDCLQALN